VLTGWPQLHPRGALPRGREGVRCGGRRTERWGRRTGGGCGSAASATHGHAAQLHTELGAGPTHRALSRAGVPRHPPEPHQPPRVGLAALVVVAGVPASSVNQRGFSHPAEQGLEEVLVTADD
jgi:hypothetical protein